MQWVCFFCPTSNTKSFSQRALVSPLSEASVLVKRKSSSTSHPKATIISHSQTNRELLPLDHLAQMRFHLDLLQSIHHRYPTHPWYFPGGTPAPHFQRFWPQAARARPTPRGEIRRPWPGLVEWRDLATSCQCLPLGSRSAMAVAWLAPLEAALMVAPMGAAWRVGSPFAPFAALWRAATRLGSPWALRAPAQALQVRWRAGWGRSRGAGCARGRRRSPGTKWIENVWHGFICIYTIYIYIHTYNIYIYIQTYIYIYILILIHR